MDNKVEVTLVAIAIAGEEALSCRGVVLEDMTFYLILFKL